MGNLNTPEWHRRVQPDGYRRDPYPWTIEMTTSYRDYKACNVQHSVHQRHYEDEREAKERQYAGLRPSLTSRPRGLAREDHEYLAPKARDWRVSATIHADKREAFNNNYPSAYSSTDSRNNHFGEVAGVRNSARTASEFEEEHIRYGGQFRFSDPYDTFDVRRAGLTHDGKPPPDGKDLREGPRVPWDCRK